MGKPFINDALVGNGRLLAAFSSEGTLLRCWWPNVDYGQHIRDFRVGIAWDDEGGVEWLDDSAGSAEYVEDSNVLRVTCEVALGTVTRTMFVAQEEDVLVQRVEFVPHKESMSGGAQSHAQPPYLVLAANLHMYEQENYQATRFEAAEGAAVHYFRDAYASIGFLEGRPDKYRVAKLPVDVNIAALDGMSPGLGDESALAKRFLPMNSGNSQGANDSDTNGPSFAMTVCMSFASTLSESLAGLGKARITTYARMLATSVQHAAQILHQALAWPDGLSHALDESSSTGPMDEHDVIGSKAVSVYKRSLLAFSLLQGPGGGMVAAPEFDEAFSRCGGYAFCWGRDAAFIVTAMDATHLHSQANRFYEWALSVQEPDGLWEHRHYLDGKLAPAWGIQLDETASLVWGMANRLAEGKLKLDLESAFPALVRAAKRLIGLIDRSTNLLSPSMDLWEERMGEHVYSAAAGSAALRDFGRLLRDEGFSKQIVERSLMEESSVAALAVECEEAAETLARGVQSAVSPDHGGFLRARLLSVSPADYVRLKESGRPVSERRDEYGYARHAVLEDSVIDVSLLGLAVPFGVVPPEDPVMKRTALLIEERLTREIGGIGRYEGDPYIGGNPWLLATLWLGLYKLRLGDVAGALGHVRWAVQHATPLGFLPEQVNRITGETAWVNPLAWSHAMFALFAEEWATVTGAESQPGAVGASDAIDKAGAAS